MTAPDPTTLPYRPNVGAIIVNRAGDVFLARRADLVGRTPDRGSEDGVWQFPQGGIDDGEAPEQALFRELGEEIGTNDVSVLARHGEWLSYDLPPHLIGRALGGRYRGQTQVWFVVRFNGKDSDIRLDAHLPAEFDAWRWVPIGDVQRFDLGFKRALYARLAEDFAEIIQPS